MDNLISIIIPTYNRKNDLESCISSILISEYRNIEIVIVDNASTDGTAELLNEKYKNEIKVIRSDINLMAGGGRNLGAKYAKGEYLLFIDSDNIIDYKMIGNLVYGIKSIKNAGMVGPSMRYYKEKNRIWWAGADINLWTSRTSYVGSYEIDSGQYDAIREVGHIPNCFMIKKDIFFNARCFDEFFGIMYEESDLAEKIKELGYKIFIIPSAKTWHNVPMRASDILRTHGLHNEERAYLISRNRVYFMKKNANILQYFIFLIFFLPAFTIYYEYKILKFKQYKIAKVYLAGVCDGIFSNVKLAK